jgi:hypothetical protein
MRESPEGTMELKTWEDAEVAATEFAELTSQLEILKEELREFCERRHDAVGKAMLQFVPGMPNSTVCGRAFRSRRRSGCYCSSR